MSTKQDIPSSPAGIGWAKSTAASISKGHVILLAPALAVIGWLIIGGPLTPWEYDPIVPSRIVIAIIALGLVSLTVLAPTFRSITSQRRTTLSAIRLGVVVLVVVFMLRPTCVTTNTLQQSAVLLVLFDQSRSMTLPHETGKQSRWQAQLETLQQNESLLADLAKDLEIKVFAYDSQLHQVDIKDGKISFPDKADGDYTDIGTPLYDAVINERKNRLVGTILMGDGVQTMYGESLKIEIWEAGEELARLDLPLYTIAFGPVGNVQDARDVAVINLPDQYEVFVKTNLTVRGTLRLRGYAGVQIPVQLILEDSNGKSEVIDTVQVTAQQDDQQLDVEMDYTPQKTGHYRLTLRAVPQEKEKVVKNNELTAFLTVLGGGLRVLYLEGDLRPEQKFLRRSIAASQDIDLDFQWIDHRLRERWPVDLTKELKSPLYDVFIIGDLDSRALFEKGVQEENLKALVEAVGKGKGLMMLGGYHSFGPGRYGTTPLVDVLPIKIDKFEAQDFGTPVREDLHLKGPVKMVPSGSHFLTQLAPADDNVRTWQALPALDGANRFQGVKERSSVLAESPDGVPLLVSGDYVGRVLAFAGDSTWRWYMEGHKDKHSRFWRQVILWLAKRDDLTKHDVWIKLSQRRFDPGSRVELTAGAKNSAGDVLTDAEFNAAVVLPDGNRKPISLTRTGEEQLGRISDTKLPGTYEVEVTARREGKVLGTAKAKFMVYDQDVELSIPEANHDRLARLASQTKGRPVAPEELSDLLKEIKQQPLQLKIEIPIKWQLGDTWQDAWLFFLALVSLLTCEWVLRKKWGLV